MRLLSDLRCAHIEPVDAVNVDAWRADGVLTLPGYLSAADLAAALGELELMFPTADGFHDGTDPRHVRFRQDEFDGIDTFPFASTELSLLAVHPRVIQLAETLLQEQDLRLYSAEAWAKYTGATDYDQDLHRDYLNHTLLVPTTSLRYQQLEMFVFLSEVTEDLGPPHLVSQIYTGQLPANPNFYPRNGGAGPFVASGDYAHLYEKEHPAPGRPARSSRSISAPFIGELNSPSSAAPVTPCTSATDPRASSGVSVKAGPTAATHWPGTSSCTGPHRASSNSSASRRQAIRTGTPTRLLAWSSATHNST
jgi:hypothetical protein